RRVRPPRPGSVPRRDLCRPPDRPADRPDAADQRQPAAAVHPPAGRGRGRTAGRPRRQPLGGPDRAARPGRRRMTMNHAIPHHLAEPVSPPILSPRAPQQPKEKTMFATITFAGTIAAQGPALENHADGRITISDGRRRLTGWPVGRALKGTLS